MLADVPHFRTIPPWPVFRPGSLVLLWLIAGAALLAPKASGAEAGLVGPTAEEREFFEKSVRPVLVANCFQCHSAATKQKGGLVLDNRAGLIAGGDSGPAAIAGKPDESRLVRAIRYDDEELKMPPRGKLSDTDIAALTRWVEMGVPWPNAVAATSGVSGKGEFDLQARMRHWSFQPPKDLRPPDCKNVDWAQDPIDRFILAELEAHQLAPAPAADKRTLLRRATFDLIGLPPTPAEIAEFRADDSPEAFAKVVERLLDSPHYGERWGRHWLDLVRFAETGGHEFDFEIPGAYQYRDYVIRAFNADLPHDDFVREHLAGDLLTDPRRHPTRRFNESMIGTAFFWLGEGKHSPVDVREEEATRVDNQIDVMSKAFLALTVGCARCHDHKFDAISTKDYYALAGFLRSSHYRQAEIDDSAPLARLVNRIREIDAERLAILIPRVQERLRAADHPVDGCIDGLLKRAAGDARHPLHSFAVIAQAAAADAPAEFAKTLAAARERQAASDKKMAAATVFEDFDGADYGSWIVSGAAFGSGPTSVDNALGAALSGNPESGVVMTGVAHSGMVSPRLRGELRSQTFTIDKNQIWYRLAGHSCQVNLIVDEFHIIRPPIYGGLTISPSQRDQLAWQVQDVAMWKGHRAYVEIVDPGDGFIAVDRILCTDEGPISDGLNPLLARLVADDGQADSAGWGRKWRSLWAETFDAWTSGKLRALPDGHARAELLSWMLRDHACGRMSDIIATSPAPLRERLVALEEERKRVESAFPVSERIPAMLDGTPNNERVFIRGSHKNLGEEVPRRILEALGGNRHAPIEEGSGRLALAERMVDRSNPLLARVIVNRIWLHHFGEGLVRTPDDFGQMGQPPTHPELLDHLALRFMREGWSLKRMHRAMMLSSTYRMASRSDSRAEETDPQNRLLHRMPVRRLEAECIRDAVLFVSGRLEPTLYGPGVMPHLSPFMVGRGRPKESGPLDGAGRRSIYASVRRNFLNPLFLAFDFPTPSTTIGRRSVSNVPSQALAMMNNPFIVEQAAVWAKNAGASAEKSIAERVTALYVSAFGRPPHDEEIAEAREFLAAQGRTYGSADSPEAWADFCHVLLNVKEFIFVE